MLVSWSFSSSVIKSDTVTMSLTELLFSKLFKAVAYVVVLLLLLLLLNVTDLVCCLSFSNESDEVCRLLNWESK